MPTTNISTLLSRRFKPEQVPSLAGRVALVTGGSAGIGYHAAAALAHAGARVLTCSANPEHGLDAETESNRALKQSGSAGSVTWYGVDMGSLKAVDELAKKIAAQEARLDTLILNAGVGQAPYGMTMDGLERHFEVNNLAHYVFALRLLPLMQKTAATATPTSVRIILQSSEMHRFAPSDTKYASKEEVNAEHDGSVLYGRSKLGLIYFGAELAKRKLNNLSSPILAISVHPGTVNTEVQKAWSESYGILGKAMEAFSRGVGKSAEEGAEACLWAATASEINANSWKEFQGRYFSEPYGKPGKEASLAQDSNVSANFWNLCANLTQE